MVPAVKSFDFAHGVPASAVARFFELSIPERLHAALTAVCVSSAILAGSWGIESQRLAQSARIQAEYQARFDASVRAVKQANVYRTRVRDLVALDRRVRAISSSGYGDAQRLAEIANAVPRHAWLTAVSYDDDTIRLEGQARGWGVLSSVIDGLSRAHHLRAPTLVSASVSPDASRYAVVKYALRLQGDAL